MTYITLKDGRSINSAHVVSYTYGGEEYAVFDLTDGRQVSGEVSEDFEEAFFPMIPAAAGFYAVYADAQEDLTRIWSRKAIIGWQVAPGGTYPVVQGDDTGKYPVGRMEPDGTCADFDGNRFDNLDALKAAIAEEDLDFLIAANSNGTATDDTSEFKIHSAYMTHTGPEKILMLVAHALKGNASIPFVIVIESNDYDRQLLGQAELAALAQAVGIADLEDEEVFIGKSAVLHHGKTGRERFTSLPETTAQAA